MMKSSKYIEEIQNAEQFLLSCIKNDLAHSLSSEGNNDVWVKPYPEVTGYLLTYFCKKPISKKLLTEMTMIAKKLINIQHTCGGFPSFYDQHNLYTFDTAQIMNGLLSLYILDKNPIYLQSALKAGDFLCSMQQPSGAMFPIYDTLSKSKTAYKKNSTGTNWGSTFSFIQVKNAEGLLLLHKLTKNKKYLASAELLSNICLETVDYLYTHPLAYYLEGLVALGLVSKAKEILKNIVIPRIAPNGFIAYYPKAKFAYVSGSVQLGILLWKMGYKKNARSILNWARLVQQNNSSGGLYQYAMPSGKVDSSIHTEINSWGTKYYCELLRLVVN